MSKLDEAWAKGVEQMHTQYFSPTQVPATVRKELKALMLELIGDCTMAGETDGTGINRFHEDGIINPKELRQKVEEL